MRVVRVGVGGSGRGGGAASEEASEPEADLGEGSGWVQRLPAGQDGAVVVAGVGDGATERLAEAAVDGGLALA